MKTYVNLKTSTVMFIAAVLIVVENMKLSNIHR